MFESNALRLYVTHPDFAEVPLGARAPHLSPVVSKMRDDAGIETIEWQWKPENSA
jgi:hypothetical protein